MKKHKQLKGKNQSQMCMPTNTIKHKLFSLVLVSFLVSGGGILWAEEEGQSVDAKERSIASLYYSLSVPATDRFVESMESYAAEHGGYLVRRSGYQMILRLPRSLGRIAIDKKIQSIPGVQVSKSEREARDVAVRLVDLKAKYKVANQNLIKLRALSKTAGLDDLLDLERALSRQLQEVENLKGEIRYLEEMSEMFTLKMDINRSGRTSDPSRVPIPWVRQLNLQGVIK